MTVVLGDDAKDGGEPKARAQSDSFCCVERLKDVGLSLGVHAAARVSHREPHEITRSPPRSVPFGAGDIRSLDLDGARFANGVAGVDEKVCEHLL